MYHYIRNQNKSFPYSNVLSKNRFKNQLKVFKKSGFISNYKELFYENHNKYLLTFDDGFKDHIYAAELLKKNNALGIFFIPTLPMKKKEILDVHKVHLILGKIKGFEVLQELRKYITKNNIKDYFSQVEKKKYV